MATIPKAAKSRQSLQHGQLGLFGVIMPGVAQVAPAFNLFFTTGLMVSGVTCDRARPARSTPCPG
jgi:hypothetical protein